MTTGTRTNRSDADLRVDARALLIAGVALLLISSGFVGFLITDCQGRADLLVNGGRTMATVTGERYGETRTGASVCRMVYAYTVAGTRHTGEVRDCLPGFSTGRKIEIVYDPANPGDSFAVSEGAVRVDSPFPFVFAGVLLLATLFTLIPAASRYAELRRRRAGA